MRRFAAVPVLALAVAVACDKRPTSPDRAQPEVAGPSFQVVPQQVPSDQPCMGTLPPGTYQNVFVPPGQFCFLFNSTLTGNLKAEAGSLGLSTFNNTIAGSIQADKVVQFVSLFLDRVGGNVDIADGTGFFYGVFNLTLSTGNIQVIKNRNQVSIQANQVLGGNIKVEDNIITSFMSVFGNNVRQNIQVFKNTGSGFKSVQFNTAGETITCAENTPPFIGNPNFAPKLERQCGVPPTPF
jgi:hypothetical protein